jgi:hypothetical protein
MYKIVTTHKKIKERVYYYESWLTFIKGWDRHANSTSLAAGIYGYVGYRIDQEMPINSKAEANWEEIRNRKPTK